MAIADRGVFAAEHGTTAGRAVQLRHTSGSFNTSIAATLTDAAGCRLVGWLEWAWKSLHPGLGRAVFSERRAEFGFRDLGI